MTTSIPLVDLRAQYAESQDETGFCGKLFSTGNRTAPWIALPEELAAGRYELVAGWYRWQDGARLPRADAVGNPRGDEYVLGPVIVAAGAQPRPDIACLLLPESCAALE